VQRREFHQQVEVAELTPDPHNARRYSKAQPGELLGLVLTEGAGFAYKSYIMPEAIAVLTGLRTGIVGLSKKQDAVIDKTISGLTWRMPCIVEKRRQAEGRTGTAMRYAGLKLKGKL
jgi:hypothetical protein